MAIQEQRPDLRGLKHFTNVHSSLEDMGLIKKVSIVKYIINDMFLKLILQQIKTIYQSKN